MALPKNTHPFAIQMESFHYNVRTMPETLQEQILAEMGDTAPDMSADGLFKTDSTQIADIYTNPDYDLDIKATRQVILSTLLNTPKHTWPQIPLDLLALYGSFKRQKETPTDNDFIAQADPKVSPRIFSFMRRMMLPGSGFANSESTANFIEGIHMNRDSTNISFEIAPHNCALDPNFLGAIADDIRRKCKNTGGLDELMQEFLDKQITVVGQKVKLSRFRRVFASAINTLFTIPNKYRVGLKEDEQVLTDAHTEIANSLIKHIQSSPDRILTICPEGGFTRDNKVGFLSAVSRAPSTAYHLPIFIDVPPGFMNPDLGKDMLRKPQLTNAYVGKAFNVEAEGAKSRLNEYVEQFYRSLSRVDAPVDKFAWGTVRRNRKQAPENQSRFIGETQIFTSMIDNRAA